MLVPIALFTLRAGGHIDLRLIHRGAVPVTAGSGGRHSLPNDCIGIQTTPLLVRSGARRMWRQLVLHIDASRHHALHGFAFHGHHVLLLISCFISRSTCQSALMTALVLHGLPLRSRRKLVKIL